MVRYKTKPEATAENERLIRDVFRALKGTAPEGLRYASLKLDGDVFVHLAMIEAEGNPLAELPAFQAFQAGIKDRCLEPPQVSDVSVIGQYGLFD